MITDTHTHLLPGRLGEAVRAFFERHIATELAYPLDHLALLDAHAAAGIDTIWNLPYAHKAGIAAALNADMAEITRSHSDHPVTIVTGCTAHPDDDSPAELLQTAVSSHGAQVAKLHCSVGAFAADDARLDDFYQTAADLAVPVVVHAGRSVSGHTDHDDLEPIARAARRHPRTVVIVAHFGHHAHGRAVELLDTHPNLWADLTPVVNEPIPVRAGDLIRLADRVLFGTDAPNTGCTADQLLAELKQLDLPAEVWSKITADNASTLLAA